MTRYRLSADSEISVDATDPEQDSAQVYELLMEKTTSSTYRLTAFLAIRQNPSYGLWLMEMPVGSLLLAYERYLRVDAELLSLHLGHYITQRIPACRTSYTHHANAWEYTVLAWATACHDVIAQEHLSPEHKLHGQYQALRDVLSTSMLRKDISPSHMALPLAQQLDYLVTVWAKDPEKMTYPGLEEMMMDCSRYVDPIRLHQGVS